MANNRFQVRRSSVAGKVPTTSDLNIGELGINLTDQILYSTNGSVVFEIGANTTNSKVSNTLTVTKISANGAVGGTDQVLIANSIGGVYWGSPGTGATFTAGTSAPVSPNPGDEWLNTNSGILFTYFNDGNSSQWVEWGPYAIQTPDPNIFNLDGGTPTSTYGGLSAIDAGGVT